MRLKLFLIQEHEYNTDFTDAVFIQHSIHTSMEQYAKLLTDAVQAVHSDGLKRSPHHGILLQDLVKVVHGQRVQDGSMCRPGRWRCVCLVSADKSLNERRQTHQCALLPRTGTEILAEFYEVQIIIHNQLL